MAARRGNDLSTARARVSGLASVWACVYVCVCASTSSCPPGAWSTDQSARAARVLYSPGTARGSQSGDRAPRFFYTYIRACLYVYTHFFHPLRPGLPAAHNRGGNGGHCRRSRTCQPPLYARQCVNGPRTLYYIYTPAAPEKSIHPSARLSVSVCLCLSISLPVGFTIFQRSATAEDIRWLDLLSVYMWGGVAGSMGSARVIDRFRFFHL